MLDFNDAQPQMGPMGELIPDGTFAKLRMTIRPGGVNGAAPMDAGLLKASATSDAKMLDCEFIVMDGPFAKRRFWHMFTVAGGKLDDKGNSMGWNIAKSIIRAMIDSALGLDPRDMSEATKQKRKMQAFKQLEGIVFAARVMVEPATNPQYNDQNRLANVVEPNEAQYQAIMRGESVPPDPINAKPRKQTGAATPQTGGWQSGNNPAPSQPAFNGQTPSQGSGADSPQWLNG